MPSNSSASPSRAGSSTPWSSCFTPPHADSPAAMAARQSRRTRRGMRAGILASARVHAETRRLLGLEARDRRPPQLRALGLLEDHPQTLERLLGLAAHPARRAELPEAVDHRGRLAERRELHAGGVPGLAREVVDGHGAAP